MQHVEPEDGAADRNRSLNASAGLTPSKVCCQILTTGATAGARAGVPEVVLDVYVPVIG